MSLETSIVYNAFSNRNKPALPFHAPYASWEDNIHGNECALPLVGIEARLVDRHFFENWTGSFEILLPQAFAYYLPRLIELTLDSLTNLRGAVLDALILISRLPIGAEVEAWRPKDDFTSQETSVLIIWLNHLRIFADDDEELWFAIDAAENTLSILFLEKSGELPGYSLTP